MFKIIWAKPLELFNQLFHDVEKQLLLWSIGSLLTSHVFPAEVAAKFSNYCHLDISCCNCLIETPSLLIMWNGSYYAYTKRRFTFDFTVSLTITYVFFFNGNFFLSLFNVHHFLCLSVGVKHFFLISWGLHLYLS